MRQITISGPGMNALGSDLLSHLIEQINASDGEPILLTGEGRAFSAGLNLKEVVSLDKEGLTKFLGLLSGLCTTLYNYPGPTVAWVNGHAIAGGCLLMLFCDQRISTDSAKVRIGLNEVALGVTFPPNILAMIRSRVPRHHLDEVLLGGALHSPAKALDLGLLDAVTDEPEAAARAAIEALSRHPSSGYAALKASLRASARAPEVDPRLTKELAAAWASDEVRARLSAALKK